MNFQLKIGTLQIFVILTNFVKMLISYASKNYFGFTLKIFYSEEFIVDTAVVFCLCLTHESHKIVDVFFAKLTD